MSVPPPKHPIPSYSRILDSNQAGPDGVSAFYPPSCTDTPNSKAYTSFGGLLMSLEGPYKKLTPLRVDYVYLLAKKN